MRGEAEKLLSDSTEPAAETSELLELTN